MPPEVAANVAVEMKPERLDSVAFEGPSSRMAPFDENSVVAYVRVKAADVTPDRPTVLLPVDRTASRNTAAKATRLPNFVHVVSSTAKTKRPRGTNHGTSTLTTSRCHSAAGSQRAVRKKRA